MKGVSWKKVEKLSFVLLSHFRFKTPTVVFKSFGGQYNDNPKYISEKLHEIRPDIRIVWISSDKSDNSFPDYVRKIPSCGWDYINYTCRAQVIVDNMTGIRGNTRAKYSSVYERIVKSPHQFNVSTWHGTPIKRIGLDTKENSGQHYFITSCDRLIAGCKYTEEKLQQAFFPLSVQAIGTPRNDILVANLPNEQKQQIKFKLGLPLDKKIVLFAPTFRDSIEYSGVAQIHNLNIKRVSDSLRAKFGGEWVFVFRVHHEVLKKINTRHIAEQYPGLVYDGNLHDDMAEYLAVTDALITDYSGSIFDYALTGKPGFLYTPDKDYYINEERGTYISLDELPYPHAVELDDFYRLIENYDEKTAIQRITEFNQRIGNVETGHAAETIARAIIKFIETQKKENLLQ